MKKLLISLLLFAGVCYGEITQDFDVPFRLPYVIETNNHHSAIATLYTILPLYTGFEEYAGYQEMGVFKPHFTQENIFFKGTFDYTLAGHPEYRLLRTDELIGSAWDEVSYNCPSNIPGFILNSSFDFDVYLTPRTQLIETTYPNAYYALSIAWGPSGSDPLPWSYDRSHLAAKRYRSVSSVPHIVDIYYSPDATGENWNFLWSHATAPGNVHVITLGQHWTPLKYEILEDTHPD